LLVFFDIMKRKIIIVNEQDEIVGHKDRDDVQTEIYRVSALWITNSKGEILLARRAFTKSHSPGKWGPAVAGTVEDGETYESNIVKEAEEELGLTGITFVKDRKELRRTQWRYFCQWFTAVVDKDISDFTINKDEVAEIRWFSVQELRNDVKKDPEQFLVSVREILSTP